MQDTVIRGAPATDGGQPTPTPAVTRVDGWRLNVLGPVELCFEGSRVEVTGLARSLLALLARTPGEEVATASIIDNLWGSAPPEDAENVVASTISRLRKALTVVAPEVDPTGVIYTMPAGYILHVGASNVDAETFERLLADGRRAIAVGQPALAVRRLDAALRLWRGAAYSDYLDQAFTRAEAQRLEDLRLVAVESRVEARLAEAAPGVPEDLLDELQRLLSEHWHRERLWVALMTALFRLGRRSDALAAYRQADVRFVEDLSIDPGPQLRAAEQAVLSGDRTLLGVALRATAVPSALDTTVPVCVGRDEEIDWLLAALDMAATRRAQARLVVGSPGIGKTRLVAEVAQRAAARGVAIRYAHGEAGPGLGDALVVEHDRLNLIVVDDLDLAAHEDVLEVVRFIRANLDRPVLTLLTCRDPVRVGELAGLPKLVLTALADTAVADIVRVYAPATTTPAAVSAMVNTGGVPARIHRAASEWAFARAGRRIDRAAAAVAEPRRWLAAAREEVVAGVLDLDHVRRSARPLRPANRIVPGCPYRGLAAYEAADAEVFHGRERAVAQALARLIDAPLLAVVGAAGAGKSSLVRAGLLPALAHGVLTESGRWRQLLLTPSGAGDLALRLTVGEDDEVTPAPVEPDLGGLEAAFVADFTDPPPAVQSTMDYDGDGHPGFADLRETAEPTPVPDGEPVQEGAAREVAPRTVVVVDQFEEAFTLLGPAERTVLFDTLVAAAGSGDVSVILVLRADAYPRCVEHVELARLITANAMLLHPMGPEEVRRAIEEPAAQAGLLVEPSLVDALVADVGGAGLVALSAVLVSLWERRVDGVLRLSAYQAGGGLARAVEQAGERAYGALPTAEQRAAARQVLVTLATRGRMDETELVHTAGAGAAPALMVLHEYGIVSLTDNGTTELVHESIVDGWPRLAGWRAEAAAQQELHARLVESARAWSEGGRGADGVYGGARLAAALEYAGTHTVGATEREFLAAGQRVLFADETRRKEKVSRLWRTIVVLALALATALAAGVMVFLAWQDATASNRQADAARLDARALAEPDLRQALRLALAATTVDSSDPTMAALRTVLLRGADLVAAGGDAVTVTAVSPAGATVAAGTSTGDVLLFDADLGATTRLSYPDHGAVTGMAFTPDARRLVVWGGQHSAAAASITVWDVTTRRLVGTAFGQPWPDAGGGLLADGDTLVVAQHGSDASAAPTPVAWSIASRTPSTAYPLPGSPATAVLVAPDGSAVALATPGGTSVVDVASGHTTVLPGVARPVALGRGGRTLLAIAGPAARLWDVATRSLVGEVRPDAADVMTAGFSADGQRFATANADGLVVVWDARTRTAAHTFTGDRLAVRTLVFGSDDRTLYVVDAAGSLLAWDLTGARGIGARVGSADAARLVAQACRLAGSDLSGAEWTEQVPAYPYRRTCSSAVDS